MFTSTVNTVSYTHLDVYKRQLLRVTIVGRIRNDAKWEGTKTLTVKIVTGVETE